MSTQKPFAESGTSPPLWVTITNVYVAPGCTLALGEGHDERGRLLRFFGDRRPMLGIAGALEHGERVEGYIHDWQIVAWRRS